MRKVHAYLLGGTLIVSSLFISQSCTKHTDTNSLIGNWTRASDFDGLARGEAVSFVIGSDAFIATGYTDRLYFSDLWDYNITQQYWVQKADMPTTGGRYAAVGFSIGAKGYVGTGFDGVSNLGDFWEYDPSSNTWTQKDNFGGSARYNSVGFAIGNFGYVTCGYDGNYLKDLWQFDPSAASGSQWVQKPSIGGEKRSAANVFVMNNNAYVVSGSNNGTILKDMWMYDPSANVWTQKRPIYNYSDQTYDDLYGTTTSTLIGRQNGVTFVMGNFAYLTTGDNVSITSTTWQYDPSTDLWLQKTAFEGSSRTGAIAFSLSDRGFVMTGRSGSLVYDDGYEFHPNDAKVDGD